MRLFFLKQIDGALVRLAVNTDIGDGLKPYLGGGVDGAEVGEVEAIQEIFLT